MLDLAAADRADLEALGRRRTYPDRSIVFFEGDPAHDVLVIVTGLVKVAATIGDRDVLLDVLGPGDLVGELAALDGSPRSASATTLGPVDALVVPSVEFLDFVTSRPDVTTALLRDVARRLRDASRRQAEYGALDGVGRVCRRLVELMDRFGVAGATGVAIESPLNQSEIAAWAGLSREAVVKALQSLRRTGWVTTTPRSITVTDVEAVRRRGSLGTGVSTIAQRS